MSVGVSDSNGTLGPSKIARGGGSLSSYSSIFLKESWFIEAQNGY